MISRSLKVRPRISASTPPTPTQFLHGRRPGAKNRLGRSEFRGVLAGNRNGSRERQESQHRDSESQKTNLNRPSNQEPKSKPTSRKPRPFSPQENLPGSRAAASTAGVRSGGTRRASSAGERFREEEEGAGRAREAKKGRSGRRRTGQERHMRTGGERRGGGRWWAPTILAWNLTDGFGW